MTTLPILKAPNIDYPDSDGQPIADNTQQYYWKIEEGLQEGEANLVLRQLKRRLGELTESQSSQIKGFPVSQLETLEEALLDFQAIDHSDFSHYLLFERSPHFLLSQSLILSSAIVIKSSLLGTAKV